MYHCPVCNYDQTGLPPVHQCPECGLAFDEDARVFTPRTPLATLVTLAVIFVYSGFSALPSFNLYQWLTWLPPLFCFVIAWFLVYKLRHRASSNRIAILPDGILLRIDKVNHMVWYENISRISYELTSVTLWRGAAKPAIILPKIFKSKKAAREASDAMMAKLTRWRAMEHPDRKASP